MNITTTKFMEITNAILLKRKISCLANLWISSLFVIVITPFLCLAQITYTFTNASGDNKWSNPANWAGAKPSSPIPGGSTVIINYASSGGTVFLPGQECQLDVNVEFSTGAFLIINNSNTLKVLTGIKLTNRGELTNDGLLTGNGGVVDNFGVLKNNRSVGVPQASGGAASFTGSLTLNNKAGGTIDNTFITTPSANIGYNSTSPAATGFILNLTNGGTLNNDGDIIIANATISNSNLLTNTGRIQVTEGSLTNSGIINNNGNIEPGVSSNPNGAFFFFINSGTITNDLLGSFRVNSTDPAHPGSKSENLATGKFTNKTNGAAIFYGRFENNGIVNNDGRLENYGDWQNFVGANLNNELNGQFYNFPGSSLNNKGTLNNDGTFENQTSLVNEAGQLINGGVLKNIGELNSLAGSITNKVNAVFMNANSAITQMTISGVFTNAGTYNQEKFLTNLGTINNVGLMNISGLTINESNINNSGTINNAGTGEIKSQNVGVLNNNGTLKGLGRFTASNFTNLAAGTIAPGNSPGILYFNSPFTNNGTLDIEIAGPWGPGTDTITKKKHDQVFVENQNATIGGTLKVTLLGTYSPLLGISFSILKANSLTPGGRFSNVMLPDISPYTWQVVYDEVGGEVRLNVVCAPPTVTQQPANQTVNAGQSVTFAPVISNATTYQWQVSTNGGQVFTNLTGATSASLNFVAAAGQNGNRYRLVGTNCGGTVVTDMASLTVTGITGAKGLVISEFRLRGITASGGTQRPQDEYIEIANTTDKAIVVNSVDGWALAALSADGNSATVLGVIPPNVSIPPKGRFLFVNNATNGYSLSGLATGNVTFEANTDIPDDSGLALFETGNSANFNTSTLVDAVGFQKNGTMANLFREGTGLPAIGAPTVNHAWVRKMPNGVPEDSDNNVNDFILVSPDVIATSNLINGVASRLGSPGPENLNSPREQNSGFSGNLFDATVPSTFEPNQVRDINPVLNGATGTLILRRSFTNNTGQAITKLRFRFINITNSDIGGEADLRLLNSDGAVINGKTIRKLTLETVPTQPNGGGLNSTLTISQPIAVGETFHVEFKFGVEVRGKYRFTANFEVLN